MVVTLAQSLGWIISVPRDEFLAGFFLFEEVALSPKGGASARRVRLVWRETFSRRVLVIVSIFSRAPTFRHYPTSTFDERIPFALHRAHDNPVELRKQGE